MKQYGPRPLRYETIQQVHTTTSSSHPGIILSTAMETAMAMFYCIFHNYSLQEQQIGPVNLVHVKGVETFCKHLGLNILTNY